ncbi:MAG: hypothetical protein U1F66_07980 [bacterium]
MTAAQLVFPDKYFLDADTIKSYIPTSSFQFDFLDSYNNTAYFYKLIGMGSVMPDWVAGFISYSVPFLLLAMICWRQKWEFNFLTASLFSFWNILMVVYMGMYSKEFLAFVFIVLITVFCKSKRGLAFAILMAVFYGVFFRIYWLLVVGFCLVNLYLIKLKKPLVTIVIVQLLTAILVFKLANVATGQYLSEARLTVNLEREDGDNATTMIDNIFPNSSFIFDWMNGSFIWFSLLFPFFLLKTAEVQHIVFLVFQLVNVSLFIMVARLLINNNQRSLVGMDVPQKNQIQVLVAWCVAFSFVQGIFEPDFGSAARHQIILIPMWFILLNTYYRLKKVSSAKPAPYFQKAITNSNTA